jgi:drug/metabolite transporter (DMT)-like permease
MDRIIGFIFVCISAAGFGTLAIFGRYAYAAGMDAITILFIRFSLSALVMFCILTLKGESLPRGKVLFRPIGMGAIGYVGQAFCYFTALHYASSGLVALLLYLYPTFVAILSVFVFRKRLNHIKISAIGLALLGTALTVGPAGGRLPGILLAISAALIYSFYIIVGTHVMRQISAVQSSTIIFTSAGAMSGILMLMNGPQWPETAEGCAAIAAIVMVATVLPVGSFLAGLKRIGPTNAAMLSTLEPVVTVVLAALLFEETLRPLALIGGGLILIAVIMLAGSELRQPQGHHKEEMFH